MFPKRGAPSNGLTVFNEKQGFLGGVRLMGENRVWFSSQAMTLLSSNINKHSELLEKTACDREPFLGKISRYPSDTTTPKGLGAQGVSHQCQLDF